MIQPANPEPNSVCERSSWREELRTAVRSAAQLCEALDIGAADLPGGYAEIAAFPVLVPRSFIARMRRRDPTDPLLRQVLAQPLEEVQAAGFDADPLCERTLAADGVLKKYASRALLITTAACPVHCRYCFRRHFPYSEQLAARGRRAAALERLRRSGDVEEVILSGGDPLTLPSARLAEIVADIESIESVTTLRIHTRFPVVIPSRVTQTLLQLLRDTRLRTVVVVHCNHANELEGAEVHDALERLANSVDLLLNQAVLLRGVNDSVTALQALSRSLFRCRVTPYYLHLLDPVAGSAHFDVSADEARALLHALRGLLPGYLVPRLVREEPGKPSKTLLERTHST